MFRIVGTKNKVVHSGDQIEMLVRPLLWTPFFRVHSSGDDPGIGLGTIICGEW